MMKSVTKTWNALQKLGDDEDGAALIEYTVLLAILLVAVLATITLIGTWILGRWQALQTGVGA